MTPIYFVVVIVISYLIGSVNNALTIAWFKGVDLRKLGSGNPGTMNMIRTFGKRIGALTLFLDIVKGALPTLFGWWVLGGVAGFDASTKGGLWGFSQYQKIGAYVAGISTIFGHIFPLYYRFKGGKGIASTIGVLLIVSPYVTIATFAVGSAFLYFTRLGSITSFVIIGVPLTLEAFLQRLQYDSWETAIMVFCLFMLTFLAHYKNIYKLFLYKEKPVKLRK